MYEEMVLENVVFCKDGSIQVSLKAYSDTDERKVVYKGKGHPAAIVEDLLSELTGEVTGLFGFEEKIVIRKLEFRYNNDMERGVVIHAEISLLPFGGKVYGIVKCPLISETNSFRVWPQVEMPEKIGRVLLKIDKEAREYILGKRLQTNLLYEKIKATNNLNK